MNSLHDNSLFIKSPDHRKYHKSFYCNYGNVAEFIVDGIGYLTGLPALFGDILYLECLCLRGCSWDEGTCRNAALSGHLDCLRYAHENGCPWDKWTCERAAKNGHLDCLRYAHENGCNWNKKTCADAASRGHLDCLRYAIDNDCPCSDEDRQRYLAMLA